MFVISFFKQTHQLRQEDIYFDHTMIGRLCFLLIRCWFKLILDPLNMEENFYAARNLRLKKWQSCQTLLFFFFLRLFILKSKWLQNNKLSWHKTKHPKDKFNKNKIKHRQWKLGALGEISHIPFYMFYMTDEETAF